MRAALVRFHTSVDDETMELSAEDSPGAPFEAEMVRRLIEPLREQDSEK